MERAPAKAACLLCAAALMPARVALTDAAAHDTTRPLPVIIDTDVGDDIDDAFALTVALKDSRLEVLGVTTAWGDTRTRTLLVPQAPRRNHAPGAGAAQQHRSPAAA